MYFNAPRMQQRATTKKEFLGGGGEHAPNPLLSSRLRPLMGKFQFFLTKPNPMLECAVSENGIGVFMA